MIYHKLNKIIFSALCIVSMVACSTKTTTPDLNTTKKYAYIINIDINASKEKVWNTITNFKNYDKWNSVLKMENNDNLKIGQKFDVTIFEDDGSISDTFQAVTMTKNKYNSFSASQIMLTDGFFKATHHFEIIEISKNKVTFTQKWELSGVIGYLFKGMIIDVLDSFKTMNLELKKEVESNL